MSIGTYCVRFFSSIRTLSLVKNNLKFVGFVFVFTGLNIIKVKSRGLEEIPVFDISEKTINGMENKSVSPDEERLASGIF